MTPNIPLSVDKQKSLARLRDVFQGKYHDRKLIQSLDYFKWNEQQTIEDILAEENSAGDFKPSKTRVKTETSKPVNSKRQHNHKHAKTPSPPPRSSDSEANPNTPTESAPPKKNKPNNKQKVRKFSKKSARPTESPSLVVDPLPEAPSVSQDVVTEVSVQAATPCLEECVSSDSFSLTNIFPDWDEAPPWTNEFPKAEVQMFESDDVCAISHAAALPFIVEDHDVMFGSLTAPVPPKSNVCPAVSPYLPACVRALIGVDHEPTYEFSVSSLVL
ncbi:hypothetical protein GEMRC1_003920 [Eukaryota sp. GEM-RC1]